MKEVLLLLLLTSYAAASGPKHVFQDARLNDEFDNAYFDIGKIPQFIDIYSLTKAQILGLTPTRVGRLYFCSDCTTDAVCVSTGTLLGAFSRVSARTTACQ